MGNNLEVAVQKSTCFIENTPVSALNGFPNAY